jgi:hypothetical protein
VGQRVLRTVALALAVACAGVGSAQAQFPYPARLAPGQVPNDFNESGDWRLTATPDSPLTNPLTVKVNQQADELCGVRGMSLVDAQTNQPPLSCAHGTVHTAWEASTGRPDVVIDVLDSGIKFNDASAMADLRAKIHLNPGELPAPRHDLSTPLVAGRNCAQFIGATGGDFNPRGDYDVNRDGVFNTLDFACDSRVAGVLNGASPRRSLRHGPAGMLTPEDLLLAFSDGADHDHNGYANDIAGWNFVDDNNDPFDDVQYGHGTGEALDSGAEANNGANVGTCPNCMVTPLRVGESFVTDANRFAQATLYATDNGADVVQEALGTLNAPNFARQAIQYAYHHGVTVIASAADEAAEHHNQPGALPDAIVVNSVTQYNAAFTSSQPSYLQLNGCTNFGPRVVVSVPSTSCSSQAAGEAAGVAGLIYSAAENALGAGAMGRSGDCRRIDGSPCVITPNEVRQLMASGTVGSTAPADGAGGQADDVDFAASPESSCARARVATCTDPNRQIVFAPDQAGGVIGPLPHTTRYPARRGFDEFYGYGRLNAFRAVSAAAVGRIAPEAEISAPGWFAQINPATATLAVGGYVAARAPYRCRVEVAPGEQPNNALAPAGDFRSVPSRFCDGLRVHSRPYGGTLGRVNIARLKASFPPLDFAGNANGARLQDSNGRPNTAPYAFTVRVIVTTATGTPMSGEDRRVLFAHHDRDLLGGFPRSLGGDGDSSPVLADLDGDNRNELVVATSDGWVHAYRRNGSELSGWPVHTARLPLHRGEAAYGRGGVSAAHYGAVLGALAAGDLFGTGQLDIVADDNQGNVYAWDGHGRLVFHRTSRAAYSGAPLTPFGTVRQGVRDRVERGFLAAPVLGRLSGAHAGPLDIVVAGEDRHVYAWHANGRAVPGFPVLVADPDKVAAVDPVTNHITFRNVDPSPGLSEDQGKLIDTPALADIDGSGKPEIIVGSNEEYAVGTGDEGQLNVSPANSLLTSAIGRAGVLKMANGRVYAIRATGSRGARSPFLPGWPHKIGIIDAGLLPDVGEGINGSPVVAPLHCPSGGSGAKVGVTPDAGPAYILNRDGSSCYGQTAGADNTLQTDFALSAGKYDTPAFAAVGYPAFGSLDGRSIDFLAPVAGLLRAVDLIAPEYQGGQDFLGAWNPSLPTLQTLPGFPAEVNDLQFLSGPVVGDILGRAGQEVIGATSSLDLAAFTATGAPAAASWPKLTADWTVATPTLGSFGSLDSVAGARKDVVSITRAGELSVYRTPAPACSPSSSPRFHHDAWNSGDYTRDAVPPGRPFSGRVSRGVLRFRAPGGDLMCGRAERYELVSSKAPITVANFAFAHRLRVSMAPGRPGALQRLRLPRGTRRYVALRAVDAAGNVGLALVQKLTR